MRTETSLLASTREQNLLLRAQAALLAPVLIHIGTGILRYGLVIVLLWIGGMKFTAYEAAGIAPLEIHSPLVSWAYYLLGEAPSLISWGDRDHSGYRDRASASKAAHFRHRKPCLGGDVSHYLEFSFYDPGMGAHARLPRTLGFTRPVFVEGYRTSRRSGLYRRRSIRRGPRTRDTSRTHHKRDVSQALASWPFAYCAVMATVH
jgi:hypothetical protein